MFLHSTHNAIEEFIKLIPNKVNLMPTVDFEVFGIVIRKEVPYSSRSLNIKNQVMLSTNKRHRDTRFLDISEV